MRMIGNIKFSINRRGNHTVLVDDAMDTEQNRNTLNAQIIDHLLAWGIILKVGGFYKFAAPMIHNLFLSINRPQQTLALEFTRNWLDLLALALTAVNPNNLCRENPYNKKTVNEKLVISEYSFHAELISAFNRILVVGKTVNSEVRSNSENPTIGSGRLDIILNTDLNFGYELTSNTTFWDNLDHANRFYSIYEGLALKQKTVVHFTESIQYILNHPPFDLSEAHVLNVWYSQDAREFIIYRMDYDPFSVKVGESLSGWPSAAKRKSNTGIDQNLQQQINDYRAIRAIEAQKLQPIIIEELNPTTNISTKDPNLSKLISDFQATCKKRKNY